VYIVVLIHHDDFKEISKNFTKFLLCINIDPIPSTTC
jgi:hypothetical protein